MVKPLFWMALTLCWMSPALAYHDAEHPITDYSASTLRQFEFHVAPWRLEVGLHEKVQISTLTLPWIFKVSNGSLKWNFWQKKAYSAAVEIGIFTIDFEDFIPNPEPDENYPKFTAIPFTLVGTRRDGDLSYNLGISFTKITGEGGGGSGDEAFGLKGGTSTASLRPAIEYRAGPVLALVLDARLKLYEEINVSGVTVQKIDNDSTLEIHGNGNADLGGAKGNISASFFWSWSTLNLRLGWAYGHYLVPVANIFIPEPTQYPEFDFFWRF